MNGECLECVKLEEKGAAGFRMITPLFRVRAYCQTCIAYVKKKCRQRKGAYTYEIIPAFKQGK